MLCKFTFSVQHGHVFGRLKTKYQERRSRTLPGSSGNSDSYGVGQEKVVVPGLRKTVLNRVPYEELSTGASPFGLALYEELQIGVFFSSLTTAKCFL
jgi:hypothetical protein